MKPPRECGVVWPGGRARHAHPVFPSTLTRTGDPHMANRMDTAQRYQLLKFLEGIGQAKIDAEGYTYLDLSKQAKKQINFPVTPTMVKKALPLIGLRGSEKQIKRTEAARANGTSMASGIRDEVRKLVGEVLAEQAKTDRVFRDIRVVLADVQQALRDQRAVLDLLLEREKITFAG